MQGTNFCLFARQNNLVKINSYESFWNECARMLQHILLGYRPSLQQQQMDQCSFQLLSDRTTLHRLRHPIAKSL